MRCAIRTLVCVLSLCFELASPSVAAKRVALVIGNDAYQGPPESAFLRKGATACVEKEHLQGLEHRSGQSEVAAM